MATLHLAQPPGAVLVVVTRRIGDVLLATPLIRSIKRAWPGAAVDCLVFAGTESVLAHNPDLRRVLTVPERPGPRAHFAFLRQIRRRYNLALSTQPGDRPTLYAWLAGRRSAGLTLPGAKHAWKRALLDAWSPFDDLETHSVLSNLSLAGLIGIEPCPEVVAHWSEAEVRDLAAALPFDARATRYAVLHPFAKFRYKAWTPHGWQALANWLAGEGLRIVLSGGGASDEVAYLDQLMRDFPPDTVNLAGRLPFARFACLVSSAAVYVGPDTATTHLAAAAGTPTIALFGPSNPVRWGPWPIGYSDAVSPFAMHGSRTVNNVTLIQGKKHCVPCLLEGCERHLESRSDCLDEMPAARVIDAVRGALMRAGATR